MKHYHGTPLGGTREGVARFFANRFAFVPYLRQEDLPCVSEVATGFAFDNSAFTAWKQGKPITDWSGYYELVIEYASHPRFEFAMIPDVVDGDEDSNTELITQWFKRVPVNYRVKGVPVWHLHESLDHLTWMVEWADMIALGSSGKWSTPGTESWHSRMHQAMEVICKDGKPKCRLHGLRMLRYDIVSRYPFYSADSTNVAQNCSSVSRFGMYRAATGWQRAEHIARGIEAVMSPSVYERQSEQFGLIA